MPDALRTSKRRRLTTADLQGTHWSPYKVFETEGARTAVTNCLLCGASVVIDQRDDRDFREVHHKWHLGLGR